MGSPLGPTFANIFLSFHESFWLQNCPLSFKPLLYKRYVDDCLIIFSHPSHVPLFLQYINKQHENIQFTYESESNNSLPFLDILITHHNQSFSTSVYRKPTNTLSGTNFFSFTYSKFLISPIKSFLYRSYHFSSNWYNFHSEITYIKRYFAFNLYPPSLIEKHINKFVTYKLNPIPPPITVPHMSLHIKLPYLGKISSQIHSNIYKAISKHYPQCKPNFISQNSYTLANSFKYKDNVPERCRSSVVYKYSCGGCNSTYIGQTGLHLTQRICKHKGLSFKTNLPLSTLEQSSIRNHAHSNNHPILNKNFQIFHSNSTELHRKILESIYILKQTPDLNNTSSSITLYTL